MQGQRLRCERRIGAIRGECEVQCRGALTEFARRGEKLLDQFRSNLRLDADTLIKRAKLAQGESPRIAIIGNEAQSKPKNLRISAMRMKLQ